LQLIRDRVGDFGRSYRALGDETLTLIIGQQQEVVLGIADAIRGGVEGLRCSYKAKELPKVTVSIGVAMAPPDGRDMELEAISDARNRLAKRRAKESNRSKIDPGRKHDRVLKLCHSRLSREPCGYVSYSGSGRSSLAWKFDIL